MILEKNLRKLFDELCKFEFAKISLDGFEVTVKVIDAASKIYLSTSVYFGGNFIPNSVRKSLSQQPVYDHPVSLKTYMTLNEELFQINLNYLGILTHMDTHQFISLLEDFSYIAETWRRFLEENDKNDLIHVRVK